MSAFPPVIKSVLLFIYLIQVTDVTNVTNTQRNASPASHDNKGRVTKGL